VVVGTVGTDHPCQAVCSVTAVELAIYTADATTWEPATLFYEATIDLNITQTFNWSGNATAVLSFDVEELQSDLPLPMGQYYW
jgi:hypothetical protein